MIDVLATAIRELDDDALAHLVTVIDAEELAEWLRELDDRQLVWLVNHATAAELEGDELLEGEDDESEGDELLDGEGEDDEPVPRRGLASSSGRDALLELVAEYGDEGASLAELLEQSELTRNQVQYALRRLKAEGRVNVTGTTHRARWIAGSPECLSD